MEIAPADTVCDKFGFPEIMSGSDESALPTDDILEC